MRRCKLHSPGGTTMNSMNSDGSTRLRQRKMVPGIAFTNTHSQPGSSCQQLDPTKNMGAKSSHDDRAHLVEDGDHNGNQHINHDYPRHNGDAASSAKLIHVAEDMGDGLAETSFTQPLLESDEEHRADDEHSETPEREDKEVTIHTPTQEEAWWQISLQVFFPYIVAGFGMVGAGMVLDIVQHWEVFEKVSEVFILVPALLGLKGNLEMTLASRLSTQANLGNMDTRRELWSMIMGNMVLTQVQAIVVGFLASVAAMVLGWIPEGKFNLRHAMVLCASSVTTAAFASFILGTIMVLVVVLSRKCKINPDNVATPIAASLGDLTTLGLLATISTLFYEATLKESWLCPLIIVCFLGLTPLWCVISHRNKYVNEVLYSGWTPVIGAMMISSVGGLILDFTVSTYKGIAVFQPVINGVGGNLVAVQASRLSTSLHLRAKPGTLPPDALHGCANPFTSFCGSGPVPRTTRVLMAMVLPGHLIFMYTISYLQAGHTSITALFAVTYLSAALIQVALLLYIANWMVHFLWKGGNDPDNFSIPYLTALGDLLGTGLLALAFHILYVVGDRDADLGD